MFTWSNVNTERSVGYCRTIRGHKRKDLALSLAKECYGMKLELLTNATVIDDAMRFVSAHRIQEKKVGRSRNRSYFRN